ncbi:MAG: HNH endonuclease [Anaerolineae bacterium]
MKYYQGMQGDTIQSTAKFVTSENYGYEMYNFSPYDDSMYGFVQPSGVREFTERTIRIERLGAEKGAEKIDNVLVAWIAPKKDGGTFLVGWYNNATVFKRYQECPVGANRTYGNLKIGYYVKATKNDCILLSETERTLPIPKAFDENGGFGQSLIWFADTQKVNDRLFRQSLLEFIEIYQHKTLELGLNELSIYATTPIREGRPRQTVIKTYDRNKRARDVCIEHYGTSCRVCGFDFAQFYGDAIGKDYIHVHHTKPVSQIGAEYEIDPVHDLYPVCANCHAMIHRRNPPYTLQEMKLFIEKQRGG